MVEEIERTGKLRVVIGTTVSYIPYLPLDLENDGNPFQIHKSKWGPREFSKRSYKVRGRVFE